MADKQHQIVISIGPDGAVKGTVQGVKGKACAGLTDWLAEIGATNEITHTPDYYKPDEQGITRTVGGGK